jgi:polyphenol oxidase
MPVNPGLGLRPFPFHGAGVTAVVTTRHGGVSAGCYGSLNLGDHVGDEHAAVLENRRRLADALGVDRLTVPDQQHKDRVVRVDAELAGRGHDGVQESVASFPSTDALITDLPGVALTVMVADCAPVVLFDHARQAIGVAHCGRGGTLLGVLPKTIAAMSVAYGTDPADLLVGIGPAIGPDSYEIGEAQGAQVTEVFGDVGLLKPTRPGHASMDVAGGLRIQLREAGLKEANVHAMDIDTLTSTGDFFSDRAARPCGRFMAAVVLPS